MFFRRLCTSSFKTSTFVSTKQFHTTPKVLATLCCSKPISLPSSVFDYSIPRKFHFFFSHSLRNNNQPKRFRQFSTTSPPPSPPSSTTSPSQPSQQLTSLSPPLIQAQPSITPITKPPKTPLKKSLILAVPILGIFCIAFALHFPRWYTISKFFANQDDAIQKYIKENDLEDIFSEAITPQKIAQVYQCELNLEDKRQELLNGQKFILKNVIIGIELTQLVEHSLRQMEKIHHQNVHSTKYHDRFDGHDILAKNINLLKSTRSALQNKHKHLLISYNHRFDDRELQTYLSSDLNLLYSSIIASIIVNLQTKVTLRYCNNQFLFINSMLNDTWFDRQQNIFKTQFDTMFNYWIAMHASDPHLSLIQSPEAVSVAMGQDIDAFQSQSHNNNIIQNIVLSETDDDPNPHHGPLPLRSGVNLFPKSTSNQDQVELLEKLRYYKNGGPFFLNSLSLTPTERKTLTLLPSHYVIDTDHIPYNFEAILGDRIRQDKLYPFKQYGVCKPLPFTYFSDRSDSLEF